MTTPRVTVPVDLISRALEEFRMIRMKDSDAVYDTTLRLDLQLALSAAPAPEGGAEVPSSWSIRYQGLATREEAPAGEIEAVARAIAKGCNLDPDALSPKAVEAGHSIPEWRFFEPAAQLAIHALRAQPPARDDAQPVAWFLKNHGTGTGPICREHPGEWPNTTVYPLYTHPAPDALRVAAQGVVDWCDLVSKCPDDFPSSRADANLRGPVFDDLRAALQGAK